MALQARVEHLLLGDLGERNDAARGAHAFNMIVARAVAAFAARVFRRLFARGDALVVWVLVEVMPHVRVALLARHAADKLVTARRARDGLCLVLRPGDTAAEQ